MKEENVAINSYGSTIALRSNGKQAFGNNSSQTGTDLRIKTLLSEFIISLSLHSRGRVVTTGRNIKNFVKSQPPFDVHRQYF